MAPERVWSRSRIFPELLSHTSTRREQQLALLVRLSLLADRDTDLDRICDTTAEYLRLALECDFTKVLDARVGAGRLLVRSGAGWPPGIAGQREVPEDDDDSQGGYTLRVGEPVRVDDVAIETRFETAPLLREHGVRSGISTVIAGQPDPFGVLQADSLTTDAFSEDDVLVLDAFADVLAGAVARNERQEAAEHYASIAAHELRTPLTLIIGYAARLLRELEMSGAIGPERRDDLETVRDESVRLRHAVDLFLALGDADRQRPRLDLRPVDLVHVVEDVLPVAEEHHPGTRFRVEPDDRLDDVITDSSLIARIATVLLDNAAKYTASGTTIRVTFEAHGDAIAIRVTDHCGGIPQADLRRIFQLSFRGEHARDDRRGLGLGLYIAGRLSEHLGGRLTAENVGDGCTFTLFVPTTQAQDQVSAETVAGAPGEP